MNAPWRQWQLKLCNVDKAFSLGLLLRLQQWALPGQGLSLVPRVPSWPPGGGPWRRRSRAPWSDPASDAGLMSHSTVMNHDVTHVTQLLTNLDSNETVDLSQPHLRQLFSSHPWLLVTVIVLYVILIIIGLLGNLLLLIMLLRQVYSIQTKLEHCRIVISNYWRQSHC